MSSPKRPKLNDEQNFKGATSLTTFEINSIFRGSSDYKECATKLFELCGHSLLAVTGLDVIGTIVIGHYVDLYGNSSKISSVSFIVYPKFEENQLNQYLEALLLMFKHYEGNVDVISSILDCLTCLGDIHSDALISNEALLSIICQYLAMDSSRFEKYRVSRSRFCSKAVYVVDNVIASSYAVKRFIDCDLLPNLVTFFNNEIDETLPSERSLSRCFNIFSTILKDGDHERLCLDCNVLDIFQDKQVCFENLEEVAAIILKLTGDDGCHLHEDEAATMIKLTSLLLEKFNDKNLHTLSRILWSIGNLFFSYPSLVVHVPGTSILEAFKTILRDYYTYWNIRKPIVHCLPSITNENFWKPVVDAGFLPVLRKLLHDLERSKIGCSNTIVNILITVRNIICFNPTTKQEIFWEFFSGIALNVIRQEMDTDFVRA